MRDMNDEEIILEKSYLRSLLMDVAENTYANIFDNIYNYANLLRENNKDFTIEDIPLLELKLDFAKEKIVNFVMDIALSEDSDDTDFE